MDLDTEEIRETHNLYIFDTYKKTYSGRFLNFHSNHPLYHKKGIIISLIDKIILLSHPWFQQKNLIDVVHIFLNTIIVILSHLSFLQLNKD